MTEVDPTIEALFNEWDATIVAVARSTARRFSMVDWEDVAQELRLWWIKNHVRIGRYLTDDAEDEAKPGTKKLMRALSLEASGYCQVEKARHLGYRPEDLFFYTTGALRELLTMALDYECWLQLGQRAEDGSEGGRAGRAPSEGNNLVAVLSDVRRGLDLISDSDRDLLVALYRDALSEEELAERAGVTQEAINKRHDRALMRLRDALGGERPPMHEGPGARRALGNAAARAMTDV